MRNRSMIDFSGQAAIGLAVLAGMLIFTVPQARADDDCLRETARIDHKLHEAIEHNGPDSKPITGVTSSRNNANAAGTKSTSGRTKTATAGARTTTGTITTTITRSAGSVH